MSDRKATAKTQVLVNADVRVMDAIDSRAEAVAWRNQNIVGVGTREDVLGAAGDDAIVHDAAGATVLPGFIDPHHHASMVSLYSGLVRLTPPRVTNIASLQDTLRTVARSIEDERWLVATQWDELLLEERRPPTRQELDEAVPDRPLMAFQYSFHRAVANSRALELAGIDRHTADPAGGAIERGADGLPNGLLVERGMSRVESLARASLISQTAEAFFSRLGEHHQALVESGITRIADATVPGDMVVLYREADERGVLVVPTIVMPVSTSGYLEAPWEALDGPVTGEQQGLLTFGPVKLVFDGAPGCAMCLSWWQTAGVTVGTWKLALELRSLDPIRNAFSVAPRVGRKVRTGIHIYERPEAREVVRAAVDRGFAVATHAIGNAAVDIALDAYETVGGRLGDAGRPRIEHATFLSDDLVDRIADVGAAVVTQPHFLSLPAFAQAPSIPRVKNGALRWLLDRGVLVSGSSDHPVGGFVPLDGVRSAVTRRTARGNVFEPDQCIELFEALTMYTRAAAEVCGCADECGTLEIGKRADLVVLDAPLTPTSLAEAEVRTTVLGGRTVFGSLEARRS